MFFKLLRTDPTEKIGISERWRRGANKTIESTSGTAMNDGVAQLATIKESLGPIKGLYKEGVGRHKDDGKNLSRSEVKVK